MPYNRNTVWTNYWMRHLSWRELRDIKCSFDADPPKDMIEKSRHRRITQEWRRRKREGGGGLAASEQ